MKYILILIIIFFVIFVTFFLFVYLRPTEKRKKNKTQDLVENNI